MNSIVIITTVKIKIVTPVTVLQMVRLKINNEDYVNVLLNYGKLAKRTINEFDTSLPDKPHHTVHAINRIMCNWINFGLFEVKGNKVKLVCWWQCQATIRDAESELVISKTSIQKKLRKYIFHPYLTAQHKPKKFCEYRRI